MSSNMVENGIMSKVGVTLVVLLLVLDAPVFSSARVVFENWSSDTSFRRGLSESNEPRTVAVQLIHTDHVNSPYMQPNLTVLQRAQNAAKRSKERLNYFSSTILGKQQAFGVNDALSSPVSSGQGDYVMQISVGTPARTFLAIVDTGSDLVWLQCSPCTNCFKQPDPVYDPAASSSYTSLACTDTLCNQLPVVGSYPSCSATNVCLYEYNYADQSDTIGNMAYETFTLTSATDSSAQAFSNIAFGCGSDNMGTFIGVDGLVGLGKGQLSLVSQLGASVGGLFSYCLVSYASAPTKTSPLLLGSAGNGVLVYTPLISNDFNPTFYYVTLNGITVNGQPVAYPAGTFDIDPSTGTGGFILDSGSTLTSLYDAAYTPFLNAISALVTYPTYAVSGFDLCYDTSSAAGTPVFPAVVFQFDAVDIALSSENIFVTVDTQSIIYCMFVTSAGANSAISIYGNVQQQNFDIAYDITNSRVGFAETTC